MLDVKLVFYTFRPHYAYERKNLPTIFHLHRKFAANKMSRFKHCSKDSMRDAATLNAISIYFNMQPPRTRTANTNSESYPNSLPQLDTLPNFPPPSSLPSNLDLHLPFPPNTIPPFPNSQLLSVLLFHPAHYQHASPGTGNEERLRWGVVVCEAGGLGWRWVRDGYRRCRGVRVEGERRGRERVCMH